MLISLLFTNPLLFLAEVIAIIMAITIHEFSHAAMATALGDPTAKNNGRLSLNPFAHLDLWGTLLILFVGLGWGKPVPFNPYNLCYKKLGPALVAIAGPLSNLIMSVFLILIVKFVYPLLNLGFENMLFQFLLALIVISSMLMIFNLIPIPPLDGSKILFLLFPPSWQGVEAFLEQWGIYILLGLVLLGGGLFDTLFNSIVGLIGVFIS